MDSKKYVFIAGLPRSGSTLFESILSQNPNLYTELSGPFYKYLSHLNLVKIGRAHV